jgi:glutathione synthase/RimK-type ligase-like ATP-grasp enzyme
MKNIFKRLLNLVLKWHPARRTLTWIATKIRRNNLLLSIAHKINPNANLWLQTDQELQKHRTKYTINYKSLLRCKDVAKIGLIATPDDKTIHQFVQASEHLGVEPNLFDPTSNEFIEKIIKSDCDFYLIRPNHFRALSRDMFHEKELVLRHHTTKLVYPTQTELEVYESKRTLAHFLQLAAIPHPKTFVTFNRAEAMDYACKCSYPQVFKTRNGAASSGIEILRTQQEAIKLIKRIFDRHYINKALYDYRDIDYGYILLQDYVDNAREFRIIKIGESWFGHEKSKSESQDFMSGSGINKWTQPTLDLLDFCREISNTHDFEVMCFDIFKDSNGRYLVNELQTWFGSFDPSQMYINGVPGRYIYLNDNWKFEPGLFNEFQSMTLRLITYINASTKG